VGPNSLLDVAQTRKLCVALSLKHFMPTNNFSRTLGLAVGLMGSVWFGSLHAAEEPEQKIARLGIGFDQHAHDAAVAAAQADSKSEDRGPRVLSDGVICLPKYFVTEERMTFTTREILTPEGHLAVAKKRYISPVYAKTLGPLSNIYALIYNPLGGWHPNDAEAMTLYLDAEQKRRNTEMKDLLTLDGFGR
jgi:hypothetical protein